MVRHGSTFALRPLSDRHSLCVEVLEVLLLLADGRVQVQVRAEVTILVKLQGCIVQLQQTGDEGGVNSNYTITQLHSHAIRHHAPRHPGVPPRRMCISVSLSLSLSLFPVSPDTHTHTPSMSLSYEL